MSSQTRAFRIFYTSLFTIFSIVLLALTLITPGDMIYQSYKDHRLANIFVISGVYIITLLLAVLIYASRIFTNRSVSAGIPKAWVPVEKQDVPKSVRRLVVEGLARSAVIAQQARPRDRTGEDNSHLDPSMTIPATGTPPWGRISHPGWTAPDCPDMPYQEFEPVVAELPHLLEAKAVSIAPVDPRMPVHDDHASSTSTEGYQPIPDARVVEVLQRPRNMCLRDYVNHLLRLNLINPPDLAREFIRLYERSRFSEHALTEEEFRSLTGIFAQILRGMVALDPEILAEIQQADDSAVETETISSIGIGSATSNHHGAGSSLSSRASYVSSSRSSRSRYHPCNTTGGGASGSARGSSFLLNRSSDSGSSRRSRRSRTPSTQSLRPIPSNMSGSSYDGGSVIHHATTTSSMEEGGE
ncbi:hypothetical protein AJ80_07454 [Polytolypa hystricis UAMH7299]|uniref:Defect at low temperature protein 1 n=1 Tax=Polytolypa hystricis (strain UAMH7299) TaxID=1447883 RepID=A0A2B7XP75_POLH7|nr:hypothetical protein AJ80_07454 [Polytolypa hystricis UAMH7299]